jgi:two-component system NtrC family sensor kinase
MSESDRQDGADRAPDDAREDADQLRAQLQRARAEVAGLQERVATLDQQLTENRHHEERLRQTLAELEHANGRLRETHMQLLYAEKLAVLGTLVAGIAHEINTPIGAIGSMCATLHGALEKLKKSLGELCPDAVANNRPLRTAVTALDDAHQVIDSGSTRVLEIVNRLRNFARMDESELHDADIHAGIDDTLLLLHHEFRGRIEVVKQYGDIPQVRCNAGQVNQVFLNLLVNAAQAIEDAGRITITTAAGDDSVWIAIADNGPGIAPENVEKIFDPGFTTKRVGVGTGLGLSICQKIVHDHRGRIEIDSALGRGTTVKITLPTDPRASDLS